MSPYVDVATRSYGWDTVTVKVSACVSVCDSKTPRQYRRPRICPEIAGRFSCAKLFCCRRPRSPVQLPSPCAWATRTPISTFDTGASAVNFTEISPVFDELNGKNLIASPWLMVPLKVSVAFCDGSTIPPQAAAVQQTASASAARNLACMTG